MKREMKDSGVAWIGEIPKGWKVSRYKYFAISRMGETILSEDTREEGIPIYSATQDDKIFGYVEKSNIILTKGDFVIPARGNSIGCISIVKEDIATCTQTTICSRNIRNINSLFLYYCGWGLKNEWFKYDGSAIPQVTVSQINNNILPLPPLPEQQKIAEFLDRKCGEIDEMISLQEKVIEELKAYKQSIITEAVTKGLNPDASMRNSGVVCIGEIPSHWEVKSLRFVLENLDYLREPISAEHRERNNPIYDYYGASGVIDKIDYYNVDDKVLLIGEDGANLRMRNLPLIYKASGKFWVNNHAHILKPISDNYDYLALLLEALDYTDFITGSAQPKLSQDNLKKIRLCIPPLTEQQAIADYLDEKCADIDSLIQTKQEKIESLKEYKKSLIYEYVTGKKEV